MKCFFLCAFFMVIFVVYTQAQCPNQPRNPNCQGGRDDGHGGSGCNGGTRWYYNANQHACVSMQYHGCGGNWNRYCSLASCQHNCQQSG